MLTVVVLNWNGKDDTLACLASLRQHPTAGMRVLVVDNGSTDGSVGALRATGVEVIETGQNLGYAGGNNVGIRAALAGGARHVCVLNNDTTVSAGMLEHLVATAASDIATSPLITYASEPHQVWYEGASPTGLAGLPVHSAAPEDGLTMFLTGCCIVASSTVWEKVGLFDEDMFLIYEDSDWSMRARNAGVILVVDRQAVLQHKVSASFAKTRDLGLYYWTRNGLLFLRRWDRARLLTGCWSLVLRPTLADLLRRREGSLLRLLALIHVMRGITGPANKRVRDIAGVDSGRGAIVYGFPLVNARDPWPGRLLLLEGLTAYRSVVLLEKRHRGRGFFPEFQHGEPAVVKNALPLFGSRPAAWAPGIAATVDRILLKWTLRRAGLNDYVVWMTSADLSLLARLDPRTLVYDCMDPNFMPEHQASHDQALDIIGARADLVVCTAASLLRRMQRVNGNAELLPNAADPATVALPTRDAVRGMRHRFGLDERPVAGYLGTLDWRFDAGTVTAAAVALPDVQFVIAGRINADQRAKVHALEAQPNVTMTGQLSYEDGYACVGLFDVGMIPFTAGHMNDAINSVKMYMYLMAGLPIVSTWIEECVTSEWVFATATANDFVRAIQSCLTDEPNVANRVAFAEANTWGARAEQAEHMLRQLGV